MSRFPQKWHSLVCFGTDLNPRFRAGSSLEEASMLEEEAVTPLACRLTRRLVSVPARRNSADLSSGAPPRSGPLARDGARSTARHETSRPTYWALRTLFIASRCAPPVARRSGVEGCNTSRRRRTRGRLCLRLEREVPGQAREGPRGSWAREGPARPTSKRRSSPSSTPPAGSRSPSAPRAVTRRSPSVANVHRA